MQKYISILRGINVGGHRKIKMDALKEMYAELKLKKVQSYVQSGNLAFESASKDYRKLEKKITDRIKKDFGFEVPVMVRQLEELEDIFENNPLLNEENELKTFHVTFLSDIPTQEDIDNLMALDMLPEQFSYRGRAVYLFSPLGYHKAKLSNGFIEKKLKVSATTRNWKTVTKLVEMARG